ncbi:MAG: DUF2171 domain-containing protein, partial [Nitrososphaeraceae archaeon]|nr:DUF2171 domain-containing protein [Nitrososphaeraceae archaeon]
DYMSNDITDFTSEDITKKEARGLSDDTDFGEVQEILGEFIITQKGTVDKERYYIPKNLVERFDGETVYFKLTKEEAKQYKRD